MCCLCGCDLRCLFACCFVLLFSLRVWLVLDVGDVAVMVVWSGVALVGLVGLFVSGLMLVAGCLFGVDCLTVAVCC